MTYKIISKPGCPSCVSAKELLKIRGIPFYEDVRDTPEGVESFRLEGYRTFPQIWDGWVHVGGFEALRDYLAAEEAKKNSDDF